MKRWTEFVLHILDEAYKIRHQLGDHASEEVDKTELGKRESLLEFKIFRYLIDYLEEKRIPVRLEAEAHKPINFVPNPEFTLYCDLLDGTANTNRWLNAGNRIIGEACTTVISIAPHKDGLTFGEFILGGAVDLRNGQTWIAEIGQGAITNTDPTSPHSQPIKPVRNYHRHNPLLACEFYRHISWAMRLLVNQSVEWADTASSFMNILRVPLGETDCFFNNVLPEFSDEGQRGHELGAIMPFLTEVQGHAIHTKVGKPLAEIPFSFDDMTPVIIGVDKQTVDYYWNMIQTNLEVMVPYGHIPQNICVRDAIGLLNNLGTQRWSLRELPKDATIAT